MKRSRTGPYIEISILGLERSNAYVECYMPICSHTAAGVAAAAHTNILIY